MLMKNMLGNTKTLAKATGLLAAVAISLLYAGAGSALTEQGMDWGDPIPGHCAVEDPGNWITEDGGCKDVATGVVFSYWSVNNPDGYPTFMTQDLAIEYCSQLNEGGFSDWALPSKDVLVAAGLNGAHGHLNFDTYNHDFVSSSKQGKKFVWFVWLYNGASITVSAASTTTVVCARNLPPEKKK